MAQQNGTVDVQHKNTGRTTIYIKGKKKKEQTEDWKKKKQTKKKNKNKQTTVATVPLEQTKSTVAFSHSSNKCHNIFTKNLFSRSEERRVGKEC